MRDHEYIVDLAFDEAGNSESYLVTNAGTFTPSTTKREDSEWLFAENNLIDKSKVDTSDAGKWMLFIDRTNIDQSWEIVKEGIRFGKIWSAKVSVEESSTRDNLICIYVPNSNDKQAIVNAFDFIANSGLASLHKNTDIKYKLDKQTHANQYGPNAFLYSSTDIPQLKKEIAASAIPKAEIEHPGPNFSTRLKDNMTWPSARTLFTWLIIGAVIANALYWSGGLAAIPFLAPYVLKLGLASVYIATPVLAVAAAALWHGVIKPLGRGLGKIYQALKDKRNTAKVEEPLLPHSSVPSASPSAFPPSVTAAPIIPQATTGTGFFPEGAKKPDTEVSHTQTMDKNQ